MKHKLLYLFALLLVVATGCIKSADSIPQGPVPTGTFTGQFFLLHKKLGTSKIDTLKKASLTVLLDGTTNAYTVTGDTAVVHAGSFGTFNIVSPYMTFTDRTFPPTGTPAKIHLSGVYQYLYDGSNLVIVAGSDTINYYYQLKKN